MRFPRFLDCAYVLLSDDFHLSAESLVQWAPRQQKQPAAGDVSAVRNADAMSSFQAMMAGVQK